MTREQQLDFWLNHWKTRPTLELVPLLAADHGLFDETEAELDAEALRRVRGGRS